MKASRELRVGKLAPADFEFEPAFVCRLPPASQPTFEYGLAQPGFLSAFRLSAPV
jgi:hypothetical protein